MSEQMSGEKVRSRKPATAILFICGRCGQFIERPHDGFVVHGNVYVGIPGRGGLIGNNFPQDPQDRAEDKSESFTVKEVGETALCLKCFLEALGFDWAVARKALDTHTLRDTIDRVRSWFPSDRE